MNHVDHHAGTQGNTNKWVHLEVLAVHVVELLKVVLQVSHIHLSRLRQAVQLKTKRLHHGNVLGSVLQTRHTRHEPLGELLDGRIHGLLALDELQLHLHLLHG